jgi:hypothetical protein
VSTARTNAGVIALPEAERFISSLVGRDSLATFSTFAEREGSPARPMIRHGDIERHADTLCKANHAGAGVFFTPNETDGRGRKAQNIVRVRAVFADFDGAPLPQDFRLRPHAIVTSSPGRFHAYWRCELPLDRFTPVQKSIAQHFGSDPAVCDLPRLMRLPGFTHWKGEPFQTRIEALEAFKPYQARQILSAFPPCAQTPEKRPSRFPEGQRNAELMKLANLWHRQARDLAFIRSHLLATNRERCDPPLDEPEVVDIAKRASAQPRKAKVLRPLAFMDTSAYLALTFSARSLLDEAERLAELQGDGNVALTLSTLQPRGYSKNTLKAGIKALTSAGFIERTREPVYAQQGEHKGCALYRVHLASR